MKKIILILLSLSAVVLFACDKVKYEFIDGFLYANGKEATGTFEFKLNGYKTRAKYVNGLANGLFERYYPDGSILIKNEVKDGIVSKIEALLKVMMLIRMKLFYIRKMKIHSYLVQV